MRHRLARLTATSALALMAVLAMSGVGWADSTGADFIPSTIEGTDVSSNLLWIVIGAVLVIFMQAGFAMVETGFCRAKHAAHVVSTNFAIFGLGFVAYFIIGFGLMFGAYSATIGADAVPVIGTYTEAFGQWLFNIDGFGGLLAWGGFAMSDAYDVGILAFFLYLVAFMDTTATIPTGSM
ncbi:MAG: hypothetical protein ABR592_08460, partial [Nitriliruptorales bacterium]